MKKNLSEQKCLSNNSIIVLPVKLVFQHRFLEVFFGRFFNVLMDKLVILESTSLGIYFSHAF